MISTIVICWFFLGLVSAIIFIGTFIIETRKDGLILQAKDIPILSCLAFLLVVGGFLSFWKSLCGILESVGIAFDQLRSELKDLRVEEKRGKARRRCKCKK